MSAAAVLLVVLSAFLHALWNALIKRAGDTRAATVAVLAVAAVIAVATAVVPDEAPAFPGASGLTFAIVAGVCEGLYFFTLARALARADLHVAYTVARGGAVLLVWPISVLALGEPFTALAALGAALMLLGLTASAHSHTTGTTGAGLAWALACAASIAGYHLAYKQALAAAARPGALFALSLVIALAVNLTLARPRGAFAVGRARPFTIVAAGALCTGSFLVFLHALAGGGAGAVLTLRNTSVVFAQLFGLALGERPTPRQIAGGLLVVAGAVAIGWPR